MANKGDIFWSRFVHDKSKYERFSSLDADTQEHLLDELLFTLHDYSEGLFLK